MNIVQSLGEYVNKVLDTNGDGRITFGDFVGLFPNYAVAIAIIFIDVVVLAAEYRVWDVGYQMTSDPFKAVGFVLVSAVPFYLGQIFWLYPTANTTQKVISVVMVAASLYTSWVFGTADLSRSYDVSAIVTMVTNLTAGYIVTTLAYVLFDDGIKANRMKKQAQGAAARERDYQKITREVLRELAETQRLQRETEKEFGDSGLVQTQLDRLRGTKQKATPPAYQAPMLTYASEVDAPKNSEAGKPQQPRQNPSN